MDFADDIALISTSYRHVQPNHNSIKLNIKKIDGLGIDRRRGGSIISKIQKTRASLNKSQVD